MTKKTLIVLATAWGPKHGGINSFNYDFVNQRRPLESYHLIAAAYLMQHAPNPGRAGAYGQAWRNFLDAHGNRMPGTVTETLKRLDCAPPAGG